MLYGSILKNLWLSTMGEFSLYHVSHGRENRIMKGRFQCHSCEKETGFRYRSKRLR
jgi:hypothetical protein